LRSHDFQGMYGVLASQEFDKIMIYALENLEQRTCWYLSMSHGERKGVRTLMILVGRAKILGRCEHSCS
jgi:hypothetical protein